MEELNDAAAFSVFKLNKVEKTVVAPMAAQLA
jgi:hypothetical protein